MNDCESIEKAESLAIKEKIIGILAKLFSGSEVDEDVLEYVDLMDDLGMDSINFISLIIELESEFDIQIPDEWLLMDRFQNYLLIYDAVETLLTTKETENGNG